MKKIFTVHEETFCTYVYTTLLLETGSSDVLEHCASYLLLHTLTAMDVVVSALATLQFEELNIDRDAEDDPA